VLSIASKGSVLSIGSVGSFLSVGSIGSAATLFPAGSVASVGSLFSAASTWSAMSWRSRCGGTPRTRVGSTDVSFPHRARPLFRLSGGAFVRHQRWRSSWSTAD
jgi:hypothetical protein